MNTVKTLEQASSILNSNGYESKCECSEITDETCLYVKHGINWFEVVSNEGIDLTEDQLVEYVESEIKNIQAHIDETNEA